MEKIDRYVIPLLAFLATLALVIWFYDPLSCQPSLLIPTDTGQVLGMLGYPK
jgi:hypothetical protein